MTRALKAEREARKYYADAERLAAIDPEKPLHMPRDVEDMRSGSFRNVPQWNYSAGGERTNAARGFRAEALHSMNHAGRLYDRGIDYKTRRPIASDPADPRDMELAAALEDMPFEVGVRVNAVRDHLVTIKGGEISFGELATTVELAMQKWQSGKRELPDQAALLRGVGELTPRMAEAIWHVGHDGMSLTKKGRI